MRAMSMPAAVLCIRICIRIRIRMDLNHFGNLDLHQNLNQMKIWIRIKYNPDPDLHHSDNLYPDLHHFADDK
jgi:hypothetical protein